MSKAFVQYNLMLLLLQWQQSGEISQWNWREVVWAGTYKVAGCRLRVTSRRPVPISPSVLTRWHHFI